MELYVTVENNRVTGFNQLEIPGALLFDVGIDFMNNYTNYILVDGQLKLDDSQKVQDEIFIETTKNNAEYYKFLNDTDWKVIRHRDQVDLGYQTSLTHDEYIQLLIERQTAREQIENGN